MNKQITKILENLEADFADDKISEQTFVDGIMDVVCNDEFVDAVIDGIRCDSMVFPTEDEFDKDGEWSGEHFIIGDNFGFIGVSEANTKMINEAIKESFDAYAFEG